MAYRERPKPGELPRWYYWDPAHWRRWQVIGVVLIALGALGRRAGCFTPSPAKSIRTDEGKPGWYVRASGLVELEQKAGSLCPNGWKQVSSEFNGFQSNEYIIECTQKDQAK